MILDWKTFNFKPMDQFIQILSKWIELCRKKKINKMMSTG